MWVVQSMMRMLWSSNRLASQSALTRESECIALFVLVVVLVAVMAVLMAVVMAVVMQVPIMMNGLCPTGKSLPWVFGVCWVALKAKTLSNF
jgi:uncharacterized membrane protein